MESRSDGDAADDPGEALEVPALEPERPKPLPKALPPEIVPATKPVNLAPFLPVPEEPPITSSVKGAILPPKKPEPPRPFDAFDEVTRHGYGHDRWGVPLTTRERNQARAAAAWRNKNAPIELSRPGRGIAAGLLAGALTAVGYGALQWLWGVEHLYASVVIGLAVGWAMYLGWGRQSFAVGVWASVISAVSFVLAVVLAMAAAAASEQPGDFTYWLLRVIDEPDWWARMRLDEHPATMYFVAATAVTAFLTSAGLWRRKLLNSY